MKITVVHTDGRTISGELIEETEDRYNIKDENGLLRNCHKSTYSKKSKGKKSE